MTEKQKEIMLQAPQNGESLEPVAEAIRPQLDLRAPELGALDQIISQAEQGVELVKRLIKVAIKMTNEDDWVNQDGRPYLTHSGAEKIARRFGVSWENVRWWKDWSEDPKGKFYIYTFTGRFFLKTGDSIEAVGTCSQRDKFFSMAHGEPRPLSEIDETNIKKAAYANLVVNGITHLLGLRSLTWDQLKEAGLNIEKIARVEYKEAPKNQTEFDKKKEELWQMALELGGGDEEMARNQLKLASTFKSKKGDVVFADNIEKIKSEQWLTYTRKNLQLALDKKLEGKK